MTTDILKSYAPLGIKIGTETEHLITFNDNRPLNSEEAALLSVRLSQENCDHSREIFAGVIETKTAAYPQRELHTLFNEAAQKREILNTCAAEIGAKISDNCFDPNMTLTTAMKYKISHPRADELLDYLTTSGQDRIAEHCVMTTGHHVSIGYDCLDMAYAIANMAARLTPLLTLLMENNTGQKNGHPFNGHVMAYRRHGQGARTNIQPYFFNAKDGRDFIRKHIDHILHTPLMMYIDKDGETQVARNGETLSQLAPAHGLNAEQFFLSEKMQYNDVKLAAIKGQDDTVIGHRIELRMADRGSYQHDAMVMIALMLSHTEGRRRLNEMLNRYGYDAQNHKIVSDDLQRAIFHCGKYLDQTMISGTSFQAMAQDFGSTLHGFLDFYYPKYTPYIQPFLNVCQSGLTDAKSFSLTKNKGRRRA